MTIQRYLRLFLFAFVCAELLALTLLPYERAKGWMWLKTRQVRAQVWWLMRSDPHVGTVIDLPVPLHTRTGVIYMANCEGCNASAAQRWARVLGKEQIHQVLILSRTQPRPESLEQIRANIARLGCNLTFRRDRDGAAQRRLNAFFYPRCYQFGEGARLEWLQKPGIDIPDSPPAHLAVDRRIRG
jgi:hypothetical protein